MAGKLYILIEVCNREISEPKLFSNYEDAFEEMVKEFSNCISVPEEEVSIEVETSGLYEREGRCSISRNCAWANGISHSNFDWEIFCTDFFHEKGE